MQIADQSLLSDSELSVLTYLRARRITAKEATIIELSEISLSTGIRDTDEVLRALYTLEGKNLVTPDPVGDFTSPRWQITDGGLRAFEMLAA